jgi:uncharacterized protein YndB with AHSA1/START domain
MAQSEEQSPSITLVRRIAASPERVFAAFLQPEVIMQWWGPDDGPTLSARTDPRVGGHFAVAFETMDGRRFENSGEYLVIEPPSRLIMRFQSSWTPGVRSVVTVIVKANGTGSELTVRHDDFEDAPNTLTHAEGWAGTLDKLVRTLGGGAPSSSNFC